MERGSETTAPALGETLVKEPEDAPSIAGGKAIRGPRLKRRPPVDKKSAPPTPDQEGCYYLG